MPRTAKTLNTSDQAQLLNSLLRDIVTHKTHRHGIRNHLIGCLMLEAGLRVGELVKLKMSDLYFNGKPTKNLVLRQELTKNHKERSIPISTTLKESLETFDDKHPCSLDELENQYVFCISRSNRPLTTRQVERIIRDSGMYSLGRPVHPHMLRHTFASKLMRVTDIRTVQELLGHSSITSTQIYTHPNEDDKTKAIADLDLSVSV